MRSSSSMPSAHLIYALSVTIMATLVAAYEPQLATTPIIFTISEGRIQHSSATVISTIFYYLRTIFHHERQSTNLLQYYISTVSHQHHHIPSHQQRLTIRLLQHYMFTALHRHHTTYYPPKVDYKFPLPLYRSPLLSPYFFLM